MRAGRDQSDSGFATVTALGLVAALAAFTALVVTVGVLQVVRHRAESAADLAALAAARHALEGPEVACAAARRTASAQGATVDRCRIEGVEAVVAVRTPLPGRLAPFGPLRAQARAGAR